MHILHLNQRIQRNPMLFQYLSDKKKKKGGGSEKGGVKIHPFHLPWIRACSFQFSKKTNMASVTTSYNTTHCLVVLLIWSTLVVQYRSTPFLREGSRSKFSPKVPDSTPIWIDILDFNQVKCIHFVTNRKVYIRQIGVKSMRFYTPVEYATERPVTNWLISIFLFLSWFPKSFQIRGYFLHYHGLRENQ